MNEVLHAVWQGLVSASWSEQAATILGLLGVWLATRQSLWNFPVGLVQVTLVGLVFFDQRLFADSALQGAYFVALIYGWIRWLRPGGPDRPLPVSRLPIPRLLIIIAGGSIATLCLAQILQVVDDPMPYRDAFIGCFGVVSQWLEATKRLEAWGGWLLVNSAGVVVYVSIGLYWFVFLYLLYLILSVTGFVAWRRSMQHAHA